jgi:hypothetical protein
MVGTPFLSMKAAIFIRISNDVVGCFEDYSSFSKLNPFTS